jgi:hypothetical protein
MFETLPGWWIRDGGVASMALLPEHLITTYVVSSVDGLQANGKGSPLIYILCVVKFEISDFIPDIMTFLSSIYCQTRVS